MNASANARSPSEDTARELLRVGRTLATHLAQAFPSLGEDRAEGVITAAVFDWWSGASTDAAPPSRRWLYRAGWHKARDVLASEQARRARERRWATQDDPGPSGPPVDDYEVRRLEFVEVCEEILRRLSDDRMRAVFRLWLVGQRRTEVYARALRIEELSEDRQRQQVKREKDRLMKHLRRDPAIRRVASRLLSE